MNEELLGGRVGFHVDLAWPRPDPCWGRCRYCAEGQYRFEDEAVAEAVLALLRRWSNCAYGHGIDVTPRLRSSPSLLSIFPTSRTAPAVFPPGELSSRSPSDDL